MKLRVTAGVEGVAERVRIVPFGHASNIEAVADGLLLADNILTSAQRATQGHTFRTVAALAAGRRPCVMVAGGLDKLIPTVSVWGKHYRWTMTPRSALLLHATILQAVNQARNMNLKVTVPELKVSVS
jgi:hypothetical protein